MATAVASRTASTASAAPPREALPRTAGQPQATRNANASRNANAAAAAAPAGPPTKEQVAAWASETDYSEKHIDEIYEYRRVTIPRAMLPALPQGRCMAEAEWRAFGITMSRGWQHYDHHSPEANVLLFRRVRGTDPKTGEAPPQMKEKAEAREAYIREVEELRRRALEEKARRLEEEIPDQY